MIEQNVENLLKEIPEKNAFGEPVTLVAAVKMQTVEDINRAVRAGICAIGDNHVQEFKEKYAYIEGSPERHFIGHLQLNKVKHLVGKVDLYHSVDRLELANELSARGLKCGAVSSVLVQINVGNEESKSGFALEEAAEAVDKISRLPALKVKGLMAMLPFSDDERLLKSLAKKMREKYDELKPFYGFEYLSMGMSGDWKLCVECGSNMIRLGTAIFGQRHYDK